MADYRKTGGLCKKTHEPPVFIIRNSIFDAKCPTSDTDDLLSCLKKLTAIYSSLNPSPTTSFDSMITRKDFWHQRFDQLADSVHLLIVAGAHYDVLIIFRITSHTI